MRKMGHESDEGKFQRKYAGHAKKWNLDPNPRAPEHHYDYKKAILKGQHPDKTGHWPSENKGPDHPNRYVNGIDTITGKKVHKR